MSTFGKIGATRMMHRWSTKDYVQNGLIAMWDGIENVGAGTHDNSATVWKDLTGNGWDATLNKSTAGRAYFEKNCFVMADLQSNGITAAKMLKGVLTGRYLCIEIVYSALSTTLEVFNPGTGTNNKAYGFYTNGRDIQFGISSDGFDNWRHDRSGSSSDYLNVPFYSACNYVGKTHNGYVNGIAVSKNATSSSGYYRGDCAAFGGRGDKNHWITDWGASGRIFACRLYSRALSADEIAHNYTIDKARFNLS